MSLTIEYVKSSPPLLTNTIGGQTKARWRVTADARGWQVDMEVTVLGLMGVEARTIGRGLGPLHLMYRKVRR